MHELPNKKFFGGREELKLKIRSKKIKEIFLIFS